MVTDKLYYALKIKPRDIIYQCYCSNLKYKVMISPERFLDKNQKSIIAICIAHYREVSYINS